MTLVQKESLLSQEDLLLLDPTRIPKHVAIIPDGNRRWAKKHLILPEEGHRIGAETLLNSISVAYQMGIQTLTFFVFSTENWQRPKREIKAQMWLLEKSLIEQKQRMIENGVQFLTIGELSKFPAKIINLVEDIKASTAHCHNIQVVFAMNYGGRNEITRAFKKMLNDYKSGKLTQECMTEDLISGYLDTAGFGDPELLIRTSGEARLSNFLLWQFSYSEIYLTEKLWPEFGPKEFLEAIINYQERERRLGG